jgi:hypothetical protein
MDRISFRKLLSGHRLVTAGVIRRCTECSANAGVLEFLHRREEGIQLHAGYCCSPQCFERAAERELRRLLMKQPEVAFARTHRTPLGLILLSRGIIDRHQLDTALKAQRSAGRGRIGDWLREFGYANEQEITKALSVQWGCPILKTAGPFLDAHGRIPFPLITLYGMLPVRYIPATNTLFIGFSAMVDRSVLYDIEQMLDCHTEPCVIEESAMKRQLELSTRDCASEVVFETDQSCAEMARVCRSYALQLQTRELRFVRCRQYIWARLMHKGGAVNILFHVNVGTAQPLSLVTETS